MNLSRVGLSRTHHAVSLLVMGLLVLVAGGISLQRATAAVSANISIWHGYDFYYAQLGLTASNPPPVTFHWMENASGQLWKQFGSTNGTSGSLSTNNLSALVHECTNGVWKLYLNRGDASEELYYFTVSMPGVNSNLLGKVQISSPLDGSTGVTNNPTYQWTGPNHFPTLTASARKDPDGNGSNYFAFLPSAATSWTPGALTPGTNYLLLIYTTNNSPNIAFTTPTNTSGTPLADWSAQGNLNTYAYSFFTVAGSVGSGGHQLKARYSFENGLIQAADVSGNGNNIASTGSTGGGTRFTTNNPAWGNFSAHFNNNNGAGAGWLNAPNALLPHLAGSFTVSLWVRTTQVSGSDTGSGLTGSAGLVAAFTGGSRWVVPMTLTGNKLAFVTGGTPQHLLRSTVPITNGSAFVHLAVTRDRATGEKKIYVNGVLNAAGIGATNLLDTATGLDIGYNNGTGLQGDMDEIQFYTGVLSAAEVAFLYNNPGSSVPDVQGDGDPALAEAVDAPQLAWFTGGAANWFLQTDETNDGDDAAQSGVIEEGEESWIETTVQGPGYFSYSWNISSHDDDYLELTVNGSPEDEINGEWGWDSTGVYLDPGPNTLRWTYYKISEDSVGADAAWLDEVEFEPEFNISMFLKIGRHSAPDSSGFFAFPTFGFCEPNPITQYEIVGPGGFTSGTKNANLPDSVAYDIIPTLGELITEIESGPWTLKLNPGHPQAREFTFTVTVNNLDVTNLPVVNLTSPSEWETGIATNHTFVWTGPTNFHFLNLHSYLWPSFGASGGLTNPLVSATSAQMPNPLVAGTNRVAITYSLTSFAGVSISEPTDNSFNSLNSWSAQTDLMSSHNRRFVVGAAETPPATPVQILNPQLVGGDFSFSLLTQSGRSHTVQSRTNLTTAPWLNRTNFTGDGNIWQLTFSIGSEPENYFRVGTQ